MDQRTCSKCHTKLACDHVFCFACGTEWKPQPQHVVKRTCCGKDLSSDEECCFTCGNEWEAESTDTQSTPQSFSQTAQLHEQLIRNRIVMKKEDGPPEIYEIKSREIKMFSGQQTRKLEIGTMKQTTAIPEKVIMMVGATGAGKTTLINAMVNYLFGVEFNDDFRYKLIVEKTGKDQSESQTTLISSYTIHHQDNFTVQYTLTIIDTPGFGDTGGIIRDKAITAQIQEFFKIKGGIDQIHAICLVVQSSEARLTATQRYIFESICSFFGKDIVDNIFMMFTFSDGRKPQALDGIAKANLFEIKENWFKFNNSALYTSISAEEYNFAIDQLMWELGAESASKFFSELRKVTAVSLSLTKDVISQRQRLETSVAGLQKDIRMGITILEQLKLDENTLRKHEKDILKGTNFEYETYEYEKENKPVPEETFNTVCLTCKKTCHYPCTVQRDQDKSRCSAMKDGFCSICPGHCNWSSHKSLSYNIEMNAKKVTRTNKDLLERYTDKGAWRKKVSVESLLRCVSEDFRITQLHVMSVIGELRSSIQNLQEIALMPSALSTTDYIDLLIEEANTEAKPGWLEKVQMLHMMKENITRMEKLSKDGHDPFEDYREIIEKVGMKKKVLGWLSSCASSTKAFFSKAIVNIFGN